jgi:putative Ca2+/H+ antiporter (TMEM165/GDT1 family)
VTDNSAPSIVKASGTESSQFSQTTEPAPHAKTTTNQSAWKVFATTFVTILLAELGDKTQVTTLLMAAESHSPWVVFAGAGSALVTTSFLGVLVGRWLSTRISPRKLDLAAGITLLAIATALISEVLFVP